MRAASPVDFEVDRTVPALIVRTGDPHWDYGALATARSLGRLGVRVFALGDEPELHASEYITGLLAPALNGACSEDDAATALNSVVGAIGSKLVAIAGDDESAVLLAERRHLLDERLLTSAIQHDLPRRLSDKVSLGRMCQAARIPYPRFVHSRDASEVLTFAAQVGYPVIAKSPAPYERLADAAVPKTQTVATSEQLREIVRRLSPAGLLFVQEYLSGPATEIWYAAGYRSATQGGFVATGRKVLAHPPGTGVGVLSVAQQHLELADLMKRLADDIDYVGPFDSDWILDEDSGVPHLIDFNPRRGAQFRLFQDDGGLDIVRAAHLDLSGRHVDWGQQVFGILHEVENLAVLHGTRALPRNCGADLGRVEWSWWATDDSRPAVVVAGQMAGAAGRKLRSRVSPQRRSPGSG